MYRVLHGLERWVICDKIHTLTKFKSIVHMQEHITAPVTDIWQKHAIEHMDGTELPWDVC